MTATPWQPSNLLTPCDPGAPARSRDHLLSAKSSSFVEVGEDELGDYRLLSRLASGGMGELFIACRREAAIDGLIPMSDILVIKRILPNLAKDEHLNTMFRDEAHLAAQLIHKNVCRVEHVGQSPSGWYIVMEYLHGVPLSRLLRRLSKQRQFLDVRAVAGLIVQACAGLQYAHDAHDDEGRHLGIVHRDVSPPNILLTVDGTVKLLDFGIAKAANASTKTRTGTLKGKNAYMAPEQIVGGIIDRRTDVFALGIVLYELLAGGRLFQRGNDFLTFKAITEEPIPSIRDRRSDLPVSIVNVLSVALARDPARRFPSAADMAAAIEVATLRLGGPASPDELGWSLEREFGEEMAQRDEVLHKARRAAVIPTLVTAAGTPPPRLDPTAAETLDPAAGSRIAAELAEEIPPPCHATIELSLEPTVVPGTPVPPATNSPTSPVALTPTPAWFVISEPPEVERESPLAPLDRRGKGGKSGLGVRTLGMSALVVGLAAGGVVLMAENRGPAVCAPGVEVAPAISAPILIPTPIPTPTIVATPVADLAVSSEPALVEMTVDAPVAPAIVAPTLGAATSTIAAVLPAVQIPPATAAVDKRAALRTVKVKPSERALELRPQPQRVPDPPELEAVLSPTPSDTPQAILPVVPEAPPKVESSPAISAAPSAPPSEAVPAPSPEVSAPAVAPPSEPIAPNTPEVIEPPSSELDEPKPSDPEEEAGPVDSLREPNFEPPSSPPSGI